MKKILLYIVLALPALFTMQAHLAHAQNGFTIQGNLNELKEPSKIILRYRTSDGAIIDSAKVENGSFKLTGNTDTPVRATLHLQSLSQVNNNQMMMPGRNQQVFYLENANYTVKGADQIESAVIEGGEVQEDYLLLQAQLKPLQDKMAPLSEKMRQYFQEKNEAGKNELFPQLRAIRLEMQKVEDSFIYDHPDSYVSLDMVGNKAVVIDPKEFEPFYSALSERMRNTTYGEELAEKLAIAKRVDIGQPAIDIRQNTPEGDPISLSSLRGRYVLLDFWASWCGPCRAENPNVLKAYNRFKDQNFEVFAVSLDDKMDPWLKAIEEDGMPWIHVSDLKGFKSSAAQEYGINAIPQNLLIDPDGIIIAKNLRGEDLDKDLEVYIK